MSGVGIDLARFVESKLLQNAAKTFKTGHPGISASCHLSACAWRSSG
jgi:hypothetical protein